jgi:hypothetical protein
MVKFASIIRSFDKFGESPKLLFKGKDQYNTKFGGLISLALNIFVLAFAILKIKRLSSRLDPNVTIGETFTNL